MDPIDETLTATELPNANREEPETPRLGSGPLPLIEVPAEYYALEGEAGRGGIGVVLRARDRRTDRVVALKQLQSTSSAARARFEREMRITAKLQHPGIVPVHETGKFASGEPFYAMKLVEGRSLKEVIAEKKTLDERLGLLPHVLAVAETIAYAHSQRVVHRDLKPSNVIVGSFGETVVVDWGLAKDLGDPSAQSQSVGTPYRVALDEGLTMDGQVLGTPAYMPLEQAQGEEVDEKADVYSLGAILYHLLAGCSPYSGITSADVLAQVTDGSPEPLLRRDASIPAELIAIVEKAMARSPANRYSDARAFADDVKRFQSGQLVGAHRYTSSGLFYRWARKHRTILAVAGAALTALAIFGLLGVKRIIAERARAEAAQVKTASALIAVQASRRESDQKNADLIVSNAASRLAFDPTETLAWLKEAPDAKLGERMPHVLAMRADAVGISNVVLQVSDQVVHRLLSLNGGMIASAFNADAVVLWDSGLRAVARYRVETPFPRLVASADGTRFAFASDEQHVSLISLSAGAVSSATNHDCGRPFSSFAIDTASKNLFCLGKEGTLSRVDISQPAQSAKILLTSNALATSMSDIEYVEDGDRSRPSLIVTTAERHSFLVDVGPANGTPTRIAVADSLGAIRWRHQWRIIANHGDVYTMKGRKTYSSSGRSDAIVRATAVSDDEMVLAMALSSGEVILAMDDKWRRLELPVVPQNIALSKDSKLAAVSGEDGRIIVVDTASGGWHELLGHSARVRGIVFAADGEHLISGSDDGVMRSWPLPSVASLVGPLYPMSLYGLSSSEDRVTAFAIDNTVLIMPTGRSAWTSVRHPAPVSDAAWDPSGHLLATACWDGKVRLWSFDDRGEPKEQVVAEHDGYALAVAWGADGQWLASSGVGGLVLMTSMADDRRVVRHPHRQRTDFVVFNAPSGSFISAAQDGSVCSSRPEDDSPSCIDVSEKPSALVSAGDHGVAIGTMSGRIFLWDGSGSEARPIGRLPGGSVRFRTSPGTPAIAAADDRGNISIYDADRGVELAVTVACEGPIRHFALSTAGDLVAASCRSGEIVLWQAASGEQRMLRIPRGKANGLEFSSDGQILRAAASDGSVREFHTDKLKYVPHGPRELRAWIGLQVGQKRDARIAE